MQGKIEKWMDNLLETLPQNLNSVNRLTETHKDV